MFNDVCCVLMSGTITETIITWNIPNGNNIKISNKLKINNALCKSHNSFCPKGILSVKDTIIIRKRANAKKWWPKNIRSFAGYGFLFYRMALESQ